MTTDTDWGRDTPFQEPLVDIEPAISAGLALCEVKTDRVKLTPKGRRHFDQQLFFFEIEPTSVITVTVLRVLVTTHERDLRRAERRLLPHDADEWRDIPFFTTPAR